MSSRTPPVPTKAEQADIYRFFRLYQLRLQLACRADILRDAIPYPSITSWSQTIVTDDDGEP